MLGIIGGTSLLYSDLPDYEKKIVSTPYGKSEVLMGDGFTILLRHQGEKPPHRLNFRSHLAALAILGVSRIVSIGSSGSLKQEIFPGSIVIPSDYISISNIPTIHDHAIRHIHPNIDLEFGKEIAAKLEGAIFGGVYIQTPGPRIETASEIRALANMGDIVGMTVASEASLACELGIHFAAICTVDNYANGLTSEKLTFEHILNNSKKYSKRSEMMLKMIINECSG